MQISTLVNSARQLIILYHCHCLSFAWNFQNNCPSTKHQLFRFDRAKEEMMLYAGAQHLLEISF